MSDSPIDDMHDELRAEFRRRALALRPDLTEREIEELLRDALLEKRSH